MTSLFTSFHPSVSQLCSKLPTYVPSQATACPGSTPAGTVTHSVSVCELVSADLYCKCFKMTRKAPYKLDPFFISDIFWVLAVSKLSCSVRSRKRSRKVGKCSDKVKLRLFFIYPAQHRCLSGSADIFFIVYRQCMKNTTTGFSSFKASIFVSKAVFET